MNLLDLVLLLLFGLAAAGGFRLGLLARSFSWGGLGAGIVAAAFTVPWVLRLVPAGDATARLVIGLVVLVGTAGILAGLGESIGHRLRGRVAGTALQPFDQALGLVAGFLGAAVLVWILLPAAAEVPGPVSSQVRNSTVAAWIRDVAPEPPDTVRALRGLVGRSRFPEVFAELQPSPELGPPPSEIPVPPEVVERVTASTGNVEAVGCGVVFEGSSWVVDAGLMVTNAHVVAGSDSVEVLVAGGGRLGATVVAFDPDSDLALLEVPGLDRAPLPLVDVPAGAQGAVVGYPLGQDQPRTVPAAVESERTVIGRDIYGQGRTERRVVFLSARLRQGDSGSPVVDVEGNVVGTVFAISPDQPGTAFALADDEVRELLAAPRRPGETGRCP